MTRQAIFVSLLVLTCFPPARAENWPGWRGPRGDGSSQETTLPLEWDVATGKNIVWKMPLPGEGHSSPIVWNEYLFVTSCLTETGERVLWCLNRETGTQLWRRTVFDGPLESIHALNSRASGTPATDGKLIFVAFMRTDGKLISAPNVSGERDITRGEMIVAAYDFQGNQQWLVRPGEFISAHGFCSCPLLFEDLVIVNGDHDGDSYIVALDQATGSERWRRKRDYGIRSYVTPLIRVADGRTQMVFSGSKQIISLDPRDGSLHWKFEGPTEQAVASMVYDGRLFYMACGFPDYFVVALRPNGHGDVTDSSAAWTSTSARCYVPSPVVVDHFLLVPDDRGTASCFDTRTGERLWLGRIGSGFSASLVHAQGLVYFVAQDGRVTIVRPGPTLQMIATNDLGENVSASPAISHGCLFLRGERTLFCIGQR